MPSVITAARRAAILAKYGYGGGGQPVIPDVGEFIDDILATAIPSVSAEVTATGAGQNVAHGLGVTPTKVLVVLTELIAGAIDIAEGSHDATNVVLTVTATCKFKVVAWA